MWPDVDRSQLVTFDVLLATRFKTAFPGYISPEEAILCDSLATFLNSIHKLMEADFKLRIKALCEEVHSFLINAIEYDPFLSAYLFSSHPIKPIHNPGAQASVSSTDSSSN